MDIVLATKSENLKNFWANSLKPKYRNIIHFNNPIDLIKNIKKYKNPIVLFHSKFPLEIDKLISIDDAMKIFYLDDIPSFEKGSKIIPYGIKGYANSRLSPPNLIQAIEIINSGNMWLYPEFLSELIKKASPKEPSTEILKNLTNKEKKIALLVAEGFTNKEIALKSNITESTVKVHLKSIYNKLGVSDRLSLALLLK